MLKRVAIKAGLVGGCVLMLMGVPGLAGSEEPGVKVVGSTAEQSHAGFPFKVKTEFDLPTPGAAVAVTWSPDGSAMAAASAYGGIATVWSKSGQRINQFSLPHNGPVLGGSIAFAAGSSEILFRPPNEAGNSVALSIWEISTGKIIGTIIGPEPDEDPSRNRAYHFMMSPNQEVLATGSFIGGNLGIYSAQTRKLVHKTEIVDYISSLCIFGNSRLVGVGTGKGRISAFDAGTGTVVSQIQAYDEPKFGSLGIDAIAGSPDGKLLFAGVGQVNLDGPYYQVPEALSWQSSVEPARILRVSDGSRSASFTDARRPIRQAAWDPLGRFVAFIDNTASLFLWSTTAPGSYMKINLPSGSLYLSIAPDGRRIAITTDKGVRVISIN
jgi:hypothetical protein